MTANQLKQWVDEKRRELRAGTCTYDHEYYRREGELTLLDQLEEEFNLEHLEENEQ